MRIAEVMADYQRLQHQISLYQANAPLEDYYEEGYAVLRQCTAEALAVLTADYDTGLLQVPTAPEQQTMQQLQRYAFSPRIFPITLTQLLQSTPRCQCSSLPSPENISPSSSSHAMG